MSVPTEEPAALGVAASGASNSNVIRRGLALSPSIKEGLVFTLILAGLSTIGASVVPIFVQRTIDAGMGQGKQFSLSSVSGSLTLALGTVLLTTVLSYWMRIRLVASSERGLSELRVAAFRHVHDLSILTQNAERRGVLVSRVTSDIDQVSIFLQMTGIMIVLSIAQMIVATIVMAFYSWQLTLVVWLCFLPLVASLKFFAVKLNRAYGTVRRTVGEMLAVVAEPVVGASVVRTHAIEQRTQRRIDSGIDANLQASIRAQRLVAVTFASAGVAGGLANAAALAAGVFLGVSGRLSMGTVIAFIFLVGMLIGPIQMATQVLAEAQNAIASWRRVIDLLDTPADIADPGQSGANSGGPSLSDAALRARFERVSFSYPGGPQVLHDLNLVIEPGQRIAVVGQTGSGKTTFAKLLTRLVDPQIGSVYLNGTDISEVPFSELRDRVLMVPQEGFLFDTSLRENLRYGRSTARDEEMIQTIGELGLLDWFMGLPDGLDTQVGQRGESLSAGARQLVTLVRSALADPDLLVLDEATSAVDPQTELRTIGALDRVLGGRTSLVIAHRLSTAESADRILVFDAGRLVEDGPHSQLVDAGGVYSRLHASWVAAGRMGS